MTRSNLPAVSAALAAVFSLSAISAATAANGSLTSSATAPVEAVGPAAKGDPKPFRAFVQAECAGSVCTADFGKKGNKVRTVSWISCGINTAGGEYVLGQIVLEDLAVPVGFLATVSRGALGTNEIAISQFNNSFEIPAGETMLVQLQTGGTPSAAQCTAGGTIK